MTSNRENIKASRDGIEYDVTLTWWSDPKNWPTMYVAVESAEFDRVEAHADDAFEALCSVRPRAYQLLEESATPPSNRSSSRTVYTRMPQRRLRA